MQSNQKLLDDNELNANSLQHLTEKSEEEESDANIKIAKSNNAKKYEGIIERNEVNEDDRKMNRFGDSIHIVNPYINTESTTEVVKE